MVRALIKREILTSREVLYTKVLFCKKDAFHVSSSNKKVTQTLTLDCLALVHALKFVEGILDFNLSLNNLQLLGCIEIAKLLPGNQHNQGFCELKRLNLAFNQITD